MSERAITTEHATNVHSGTGEDGVIGEILDRLPETDRWCVEFGAWDGLNLSNTRHLIESRGYAAVLIEADPAKCVELRQNCADFPRVQAIEAFVGLTETDGLDALLRDTDVPTDFDVLSIDIDGNDYHVWAAVTAYRPKVVCIEFNPTIPTDLDYVQDPDSGSSAGASLAAIVRLGKEKGYELAAVTLVNAVLVRADLFAHLGITDNAAHTLRRDTSLVTHVFTGYDGTVHVAGNTWLPWHALPMKVGRQALPRALRRFPGEYGRGQRLLMTGYHVLRYPRLTVRRLRKHGLPR